MSKGIKRQGSESSGRLGSTQEVEEWAWDRKKQTQSTLPRLSTASDCRCGRGGSPACKAARAGCPLARVPPGHLLAAAPHRWGSAPSTVLHAPDTSLRYPISIEVRECWVLALMKDGVCLRVGCERGLGPATTLGVWPESLSFCFLVVFCFVLFF